MATRSRRMQFAKYLEMQMKEIDMESDALLSDNLNDNNLRAISQMESSSKEKQPSSLNDVENTENTENNDHEKYQLRKLNDKISARYPQAPAIPVSAACGPLIRALELIMAAPPPMASSSSSAATSIDDLTKALSLAKRQTAQLTEQLAERDRELHRVQHLLASAQRDRDLHREHLEEARERADSAQAHAQSLSLTMNRRVAAAQAQKDKCEKECDRLKDKLRESLLSRRTQRAPANSVIYGECLNVEGGGGGAGSLPAEGSLQQDRFRIEQLEREKAQLQRELISATHELAAKEAAVAHPATLDMGFGRGHGEAHFAAAETAAAAGDGGGHEKLVHTTADPSGRSSLHSASARSSLASNANRGEFPNYAFLEDDFSQEPFVGFGQRSMHTLDTPGVTHTAATPMTSAMPAPVAALSAAPTPSGAAASPATERAREARQRLQAFLRQQETEQQNRQQPTKQAAPQAVPAQSPSASSLWAKHKQTSPFLKLSPARPSVHLRSLGAASATPVSSIGRSPSVIKAPIDDDDDDDDSEIQISFPSKR